MLSLGDVAVFEHQSQRLPLEDVLVMPDEAPKGPLSGELGVQIIDHAVAAAAADFSRYNCITMSPEEFSDQNPQTAYKALMAALQARRPIR